MKKTKRIAAGIWVGAALLLLCIVLLGARMLTGDYLDENGILHEYFFLVPMAAGCFLASFAVLLVTGIRNTSALRKSTEPAEQRNRRTSAVIAFALSGAMAALFVLLLIGNR